MKKINQTLLALIVLSIFISDTSANVLEEKVKPLTSAGLHLGINSANKGEDCFIMGLGFHQMNVDYNNFSNVFQPYNLELLNKPKNYYAFEVSGVKNNYYYQYQFGLGYHQNNNLDSIKAKVYNLQNSFTFGYSIVNTKRFMLVPNASLIWNTDKLINHQKDKKVDLGSYLENKEMTIDISQLYGALGIKTFFKFNKNQKGEGRFALSAHVNYALALHKKTFMYSTYRRVTNNSRINTDNLFFGFSGSYMFLQN